MHKVIYFNCKKCDLELETSLENAREMKCPHCGISSNISPSDPMLTGGPVDSCASCGHENLYVQKDFNRTLGLTIVVAGILLSLFFFYRNEPFHAMLTLLGMAVIDGVIYMMVSDVTVCYVCHTIYRGFTRNPGHEPFELALLERYGGRTPRR